MSSEDETDFVPTAAEDAYPANDYSIAAPEDPVFFATQQVEPVTPAPEDPSITPTVFISDIVPIPISEAEGLTDSFVAADPNGAELPPSTTVTGLFPNNVVFEGGVVCTLTGSALDLVSEVRIMGTVVPFVLIDPGTLQFTTPVAPDNSGGTKAVEVYDAYGVMQGFVPITYDPQVAVFGVNSVAPTSGTILGGQEIILNGSAFYYIANVTIDNEPVYNFEILNSTALKIVTPPGRFTGNPVDVSVHSFDGSVRTLAASYTYTYPPPFLLGLDTSSGDVAGGTQVEIAGAFLTGATSVLIDGNPVTSFTVDSAGAIRFTTPASVFTGIPLDVTVTTPYGSDTLFGAFTYSTTAPVPIITSVSPPKGLIGTFAPVTITGSGFNGTLQVEFDGVAASSFAVESDTKITCTAPFGSFNGGFAINVKITTFDGSFTKIGSFTFVYDAPTVSSTTLTTDLVSGGTPGTLTGTNFYEVSAVTIAGVPVQSFTVVSPTQIDYVTGTAPNDNVLPGDIQVITLFGIATLSSVFTYTYPPVTISTISLNTGFASGGTTVVLTGTGFTLVTQVFIAGILVSNFTVDSLTQITCVTPPDPNPTNTPGDVVVKTVFSQATLPNAFTYVPTMQLVSSSASTGITTGGENVTLTGVGFANIQSIFFVGVPVASFTIVDSSTVQVVTGFSNTYGVLGNITILTTFGENVVLTNAFSYYPALTVTAVDINKGLSTGNQIRTLTGTGFDTVTSVSVCGVSVLSFTAVTPTTLNFTTAPSATLGTGDIIVTTANETWNLANSFTYYPAMLITSISVSDGPATGGTSVVITGSGFFQVNSVQFNATEVTSFTVDSLTQITVTTASKTLSDGELGNVVVTSSYTSDTLSNAWTYWPIMNVASLDVSNGPTTGGTTVVITGSGFYAVTDVRFNSISAASFTVDSPTQITALTGIGALNGTGNVEVDSIYTSATKSNAWTYWQPMAVSTLSVSSGPRAGGTSVVITGAGFYSVTGVTFNGVAVASYTVNSLTQITVVTGAKPSSNGDLGSVVVTSTYTSATKTNAWTYYPPMSVTSLDVSNGPKAGGTTVVITGTGFYSVNAITFNGTPVTSYTVDSLTQITVVTGAKSSSTGDLGDVVVTSPYTSATGSNLWTYYAPVVVSSLNVSNGPRAGGTTVVITGSGFYFVSGITFNGVAVTSYTVDSLTQITVVTGAKPSSNGDLGNVVVTTNFTSGTGTNLWTYYPPMSVTSLDVSSGPKAGGTTVVITGAGFYSVSGVTFNGVAVASYTINSLTQITVVTGAKPSSTGDVGNVVVTSNFTSATGTNLWTYYAPVVVTSLDVSNGPRAGGTTVVITGSGFYSVSGLTFNGVAVASYTVDSLTQITVLTGAKPSSNGDVGDVVVTTSFTSGTKSNAWTYYPPMSVTSLDVSNGPRAGGTTVVITGAGFYSVSGITFNGTAVASYTVDSITQITVVTGTKPSSTGDLGNVVVTSNFTSATGTNLWTYYAPVVVTSLDVTNGPRAGGTTVVVTGSGFYSVSGITFNGVAVTSYTVDSLTQLTVVTGPKVTSNGEVGNVVVTTSFTSGTGTNLWTYYPPMSVTSLDVSNGPKAGGTTVVITGAGFYSLTGITFNGVAVASYTVDSVTQITVVTGAKPSSTGDVGNVVVTSNFTSATGTNLWTYYPPVTVSSLDVSNGPRAGGTTVVLTGSGFYSVSGVTFNGVAVASYTVDSLTQITVVTGAKPSSNGDVGDVVVVTSFTSGTKSNAWTYYPPMSVTSLDVSNGPKAGGTTVVITGVGFYSVSGVTFNGTAVASYTVDSLTQITVVTGTAASVTAPSTGNVVVTSTFTSATGTSLWTYYSPIVVSSLDVAVGNVSGGTTVNITGSGFYSVNSVTFKGIEVLSKTVNSPTSMTIVTKGDVTQLLTRLATGLNSDFVAANAFAFWMGGTINKFVLPGSTGTAHMNTSGPDGVTFTVAQIPTGNPLRYAIYVPSLSKMYMAGGGNFADRFVESSDGITFTSPGVLPLNYNWNWMTYSPTLGMFVVVSRPASVGSLQATPIATSTDGGATWTLRGTGTPRSFGTVTWCSGFGKFVATGFTNVNVTNYVVAYSSDGITWTEVDLTTQISGDVQMSQSAEYSEDINTLFVTGDTYGFVTTDGINYTRTPSPLPSNPNPLPYSSYMAHPKWISSLGVFVGAASGTDILCYSPDGLTWTGVTPTDSVGLTRYGLAWSPEYDALLVTAQTANVYTFTNPENATGDVVVTSTYTSGTKANAYTFSPKIVIGDVDVGYGPTTGGTTVKIYGRGFRDVTTVSFKGVNASSFTVSTDGTMITAVTAAGTAGTGDIVVTNAYRTATLTNGFSYKNVPTATSDYDNLTSVAKTSLVVVLQMRPVLASYTGPLFRVLRTSDRAITDVYGTDGNSSSWFTKNGVALSTWKGASTLRVVRWFDQSGSVLSSDAAVPKPPTSGTVFAYQYALDNMPVLDTSVNCIDFTAARAYMLMANNVTPAITSPYTIAMRHGTVGNSSAGELWLIGSIVSTPPGSGKYLQRSGSNYINVWPGVNTLTLTGAYATNQTVMITDDLTTRTGYAQTSAIASLNGTLAGNTNTHYIGGRGSTTEDSLAQIYSFVAASTVFGTNDRLRLVVDGADLTIASTSVSNGTTNGGTTVVITGTGFYGINTVSFGGVNAASFTVDSPTQITAVTASTTAVGAVGDIVVSSPIDSATSTNGWTYWPPMSFTSIDVSTGLNSGGTTVVVTGSGFYAVSSVTFGGTAVASYTVDSATQITVSTGVSSVTAPTLGNVVVTSPYTSATGTNVWTYYPPIVVSSLDVSYGKVSGGTTVNITGSGFHNVNSVTFKGIEVLSKTVNSPTSITVTVKGDVAQLVGRNAYMGTGPPTSNFIGSGTFHCWAGGSIQKWIVPGTYIYTSSDSVTFTVADVPTPGLRYAMYVPSLGKAYVIGNGNFANRFLESTDGITWTSPGVLPVNRSWNWAAYSPTLDVFVVVNRQSTQTATPFAVSTDRGATWTEYGTGTPRSFGTVVWCTAIGKFVASGWSNVSQGIVAYSVDGITWTEENLNVQFPSVNTQFGQTVGVSEDLGVVVFFSGSGAFVYNGTAWQRGALSSQINNPVWVPSVYAFVGLKNGTTYAYSADGLTWTDVTVSATGVNVYGSFAYSPEQDVFLATSSADSNYNFTSPDISTNASVVVTSTYTSGTKANAWAFVPTMAISDVDIGYGPTAGSTTVKIYGRGFRNINPGSVTFNGIQATSFTNDGSGCLITAVTAAGTAGTGNIVCANSFRSATLTNGWSYKNVSVSSYNYDALTSAAKTSLSVVLQMRPVLSTYTGPLFRVWRVSDGAVTDVYASSGSSTDWFTKNGVAISTFQGASTLRVVRWFDQSGNTSGTDGAIPKPPNSGVVFGYAYQPRYMPVLDLTNNCLDFSGGSYFMRLQDGTLPAVTSPYTITLRHGTVGNSTNGEFWNIGTNSNTAPGSGNYLRRQGSNYINNWPGVGQLTLTGSYANNQVVTFTNDLTTRTGYVEGMSAGSVAGTLAGDTITPTLGGRGDGTVDSLAQVFFFAYASSVFGTPDRSIFEDIVITPPVVTSLNVSSGPTTGGTTVVITGTGFSGTTTVSFGGTNAASFTVDSATQITAVTASGSAGRGNIVVTNSGGSDTFTNGWIYYQTNYTRYFAVTDISTTTGLNKTASSFLTTVTFSSALGLFIVADSQSGITQPYITSPDATTWTRQTAPSASGNDSINDIAASPTAIVSCGVLPLIRRSTNGTTWTNVTSTNTLTFRIAYSPSLSRWAIGRGGTNGLYYSNNDGATWTAATGASVYVACVIWNTSLAAFYVFMRNGGSVYSSTNGTSYTLAANNVLANDNYHAAAYSSDRNEMVTIGNYSANVYTSTNGTTWTLRSTITGTQVVGVTWSTELYMYVACTDKGLYASVDATAWIAMNPLTWSGTFDYSWGRWVYSPTARRGVAAYVNTVFRTEDTVRASLSFAAGQNVQITNDTDLRPGTGDFTVEWFQYQTAPSAGTTPYVFSIANDLAVSVNGSTGLMSVFVGGSAVITFTPTNVYGRWCHFAVTRTGTTLGLFKDGARLTTVTNSTNIANTTAVLRIANSSTTSGTNQFLGRLTNFHFVNGTAVYTGATYTVPTREIFAIANSKVLLPTPTGNLVRNYSGVAKTITNNGATSSSENPFYL